MFTLAFEQETSKKFYAPPAWFPACHLCLSVCHELPLLHLRLLFPLAVTQIFSSPASCLPFIVCLGCVSLTSSHLWRGCRGCSFRRRPAAGGRLRWHGDSPTLSGHCTGWLCLTCQTKSNGISLVFVLFFFFFCFYKKEWLIERERVLLRQFHW